MALLTKSTRLNKLYWKNVLSNLLFRNIRVTFSFPRNSLHYGGVRQIIEKSKDKKKIEPKRNFNNIEEMVILAENNDVLPRFEEKASFNFSDNLSAVLYGIGDLRLEQRPLPKYSEKEVLIATECVGLSKADINFISKREYKNYVLEKPLILGHEASGTVAEVGCKVTKFRPGDRVAIEPTIPCRICEWCKKGRFNLCPDIYFCGMPPSNGTLSRFFAWPEDFCLKLPHHVGFDEAALLEPLAVAHHACKRGGITVGSKVVICGSSPIGILSMLCAKACGATNIIVTDTKSDRLRCANTMGANNIIFVKKSAKDDHLTKEILEALGGQAHVCLECSGSPQALRISAEITKPGGTIVLVTPSPFGTAIQTKCLEEEIDIRGVLNYCNNYQNALDLIATGRLDFTSMITHDYKLTDIMQAYNVAKTGRAIKILIHTNPKWIPSRRRNY
ncbi:hypothetical protein ILUMI_12732 [Ignelater luminosus]|uniref:Sorbitol dehydrogenase n=1 Tax=Ignelater luminosus TaxID=2038154 RepID=A0A8K0CY13_IGNLU|nr:hypothetical protein ILUMI_12732 [Ignelater luminosus]